MKKILVLMLVLGIASMATAGLQLTVNGVVAEDSSIVMAPSDYALIGLYNDGSVPKTVGYISIASGPGSWTGGYAVYVPPATGSAYAYAYYYGPITGMGDTWILFDADAVPGNINGIGILADFEFHCDDFGDVTITYIDSAFGLMDTLVIHQIPEPITLALLGLGGLFLRRRK